jgi:hypothetical protein
MVYPSTDYLGARVESDPVRPVNQYAASKYAGELVVGSATPGLVVRGSWYSHPTYSHAATDAFTSRLPVDKAAFYVATLAVSSATGVVNIGGQTRSVYEIALEFNPRVAPVGRLQIQCGYEIPADCSLDTAKLNRILERHEVVTQAFEDARPRILAALRRTAWERWFATRQPVSANDYQARPGWDIPATRAFSGRCSRESMEGGGVCPPVRSEGRVRTDETDDLDLRNPEGPGGMNADRPPVAGDLRDHGPGDVDCHLGGPG